MVKITEDLVRKRAEHNECLISTLEELTLHQEDIERIEHLQNWCRDLKILLLQSNLISKIENLHKLKCLEYLNLAMNNIERVENLERLESLNKLDLTLNFIGELTSIENLCGLYNLKELILTGNPCCDYPNYREYVVATLPQLETLDCEEVKITDKLRAKKQLQKFRAIIVQKQVAYAIERDEQKIRYQQQKEVLRAQMDSVEDEEERNRIFWQSKSENCPEIRNDIAEYHRKNREPKESEAEAKRKSSQQKKTTILFAPCGRPYNLNQAKLPFTFKDERKEFILELSIYKYLDTSQIKVDIQPNYIRVTVKAKIFQITLSQEVKIEEAIIQRSQTTGELLIRVQKLHFNEPLAPISKRGKIVRAAILIFSNKIDLAYRNSLYELFFVEPNQSKPANLKCSTDFKGTVDIRNICANAEEEVPDLI